MTLRETLAGAVRDVRTQRGLTQKQAAEVACVSVDTIRRLERRRMSPTVETLEKIAAGFDMPMWELIVRVETETGARTPRDYVRDARATFMRGEIPDSMRQLADAFGVLRGQPGFDPWDPERLASETAQAGPASTRHAARFVLSVYDHQGVAFNIHAALRAWDLASLVAFRAWVADPWWGE